MSELIVPALDLIWKLVSGLKGLTGARRRDFFFEVVNPLNEKIDDVHAFYNKLFLHTRDQVSEIRSKSSTLVEGGRAILSPDGHRTLEEVKEGFRRARMTDEGLRLSLRRDAQEFLAAIPWKEEKRFMLSIVHYFLNDRYAELTPAMLDDEAAEVHRRGGESVWDTPSLRLYFDIEACRDLEELMDLLDSARDQLNQAYVNVRHEFRSAKHQVIMRT